MRRTLLAILGSILLVSACAGATTGSATPAATVAPSTVPGTSQSQQRPPGTTTEAMTSSTAGSTTTSTAPGTTITTGSSEYGDILFDGNRQAIYLFDKETSGTPDCYDDCAAAWPPVLTTGTPVPSGDIDGARLGTADRADGTVQVTYGGHPLYYYAHEGPGEVTCHDVRGFGGLWLVVTPSGEAAPS